MALSNVLFNKFKLVNGSPFVLELLVLHSELKPQSSPIEAFFDASVNKYFIRTNSLAKSISAGSIYKGMEVKVDSNPQFFILAPTAINTLNSVSLTLDKSIESEFFTLRASEISETLERYWELFNNEINRSFASGLPPTDQRFYCPFNHLGYSFLLENTKIFEIFHKIMELYINGETLTHPTIEAARWLQNTTKLMFNDEPIYSNFLVTNKISTSEDTSRRNSYKRLFGADLSHGNSQNQNYPKSNINNDDFFRVYEEFLKLSWIGQAEYTNTSGTNYTESERIKTLADDLKSMLLSRRTVENSLENYEFLDLSTIEFKSHLRSMWFYHAISYNSPIIKEMSCEGTSAFDRLQKMGSKVGINCHSKTSSFMELAPLFGFWCRSLELDMIDDGYISSMLTPQTAPHKHVTAMINLYEATTGKDIKQRIRA